jgi:hypothetical protein
MNARKQSDRDIQKWLASDLSLLRKMKTGEVAYIRPLYVMMLKASIKKCYQLLRLT